MQFIVMQDFYHDQLVRYGDLRPRATSTLGGNGK